MKRIDPVVLKETKYILFWSIILSALMQAVFLVIGKWDYTVVLGNALSVFVSVLNFFLMGFAIQKALEKDEKDAKGFLTMSRSYRFLLLIIGVVVGIVCTCFNTVSVIIPIFFPRIAIMFRPLFEKK